MTPINSLKERFNRDSLPTKWGSVASDLLRLSSMAHVEKIDSESFQDILLETKLFTEWLAPQINLKNQKIILSLQRDLSEISYKSLSNKDVEVKTQKWSEKVLKISGLV